MSKQIVSRKWMGCALVLGLAACGSSSKPGAAPAGSSGAVANVGTSGDTAMPAADRNLVVRHGPMTYVMDTPRNQLEKAGVALEESGLVAALRGRGIKVIYEPDPDLGDDVILMADGEELARTTLDQVDGKETPADVLAAVDDHFGTTP